MRKWLVISLACFPLVASVALAEPTQAKITALEPHTPNKDDITDLQRRLRELEATIQVLAATSITKDEVANDLKGETARLKTFPNDPPQRTTQSAPIPTH